ncbi:MAG: hypothetical protein K2X66_17040 [Cyanobacteria bacterium]|nr:hypothetical protein [Cyanobacteriota bacterium]
MLNKSYLSGLNVLLGCLVFFNVLSVSLIHQEVFAETSSVKNPNIQSDFARLKKDQNDIMSLWYTNGIQIEAEPNGSTQKGSKSQQIVKVHGQGRLALQSKQKGILISIPVGGILIQEPNTLIYLDQVGTQARLMVLKGKASLLMSENQYPLIPSLQAMVQPEEKAKRGRFLYDGIYRRPILMDRQDGKNQVIIRQFYLEQLVHIDPLMKAIYADSTKGKKLVERLNKSAANLRMINGVQGYEPKQM